jgi:hypothetical protein
MNKTKIKNFLQTLRKNNLILYYNHGESRISIKYIGIDKNENQEEYLKSMKVYKKAKPYILKNKSQLKEYFFNEYINKTRSVYLYDPRPELEGHKIIKKILYNSYKTNKDLYNIIHGLRCVGLILTIKNKKISLSYDKNSNYFKNEKDFFETVRKYLGNKSKEINKLIAS